MTEGFVTALRQVGYDYGVLAQLLGRNHVTVRRWETGESVPTPWESAVLSVIFNAARNDPESVERAKHELAFKGTIHALCNLLIAGLSTADTRLDFLKPLGGE